MQKTSFFYVSNGTLNYGNDVLLNDEAWKQRLRENKEFWSYDMTDNTIISSTTLFSTQIFRISFVRG